MTKLEELKLQREGAQLLANQAYEPYKALIEKTKEDWTNHLKMLMPVETNIRIGLDYSASITIEVVDEKGEDIFGADCDLRIDWKHAPWSEREKKDFVPSYELRIGCGTCGDFTKNDYGQVNKYKIMGILMENFELLEGIFTAGLEALKPLRDTYYKAENLVERADSAIKAEEERIAEEEFLKTVDYSATYKATDDSWRARWLKDNTDGYRYIKFEKTTDKCEFILVGEVERTYNPTTGDWVEAGDFRPYKSKRVDKGTFVNWLKYNRIKKLEINA